MGNAPSNNMDNPNGSLVEVYTLYKTLAHNSYTSKMSLAHHICLLKFEGKFYYTDLSSDGDTPGGSSGRVLASTGKGRIRIQFGEYRFYPGEVIYYSPKGVTQKTLAQIEQFGKGSPFNDTNYSVVLQNCQHYVRSCENFLGIKLLLIDELWRTSDPSCINLISGVGSEQLIGSNGIVGRTIWTLHDLVFLPSTATHCNYSLFFVIVLLSWINKDTKWLWCSKTKLVEGF